ncbi:MAG: hypothetical protein KAJ19_13300 [Gammaproteobacteria bacterium]|nr:hypothetical protein [Gammaproteobacteria bacterium]
MLEQKDTAVIFYASYIESKVGKTGLTVTVNVWEIQRDGTATEIVSADNATEIGDGLYRYLLVAGSVDEPAEYIAVFKTSNTDVDQRDIPAMWVIERAGIEDLDAAISSRSTMAQADILDDATPFSGANVDQAISTTESNIRGADSDDLKDISDEIGVLNNITAASVWAVGTRTLTSFGTLVADIWAAGTRTLTSLGTLVADVWAYTRRTLTNLAVSSLRSEEGVVTVYNYTTWTESLGGLGSLADRTFLYFTVKKKPKTETDAESLLQIKETKGTPSTSVLLYFNGADQSSDPTKGTLVVDDENLGSISFTVDVSLTGIGTKSEYTYEVKKVTATQEIRVASGQFDVDQIVTRSGT